jgi:hypothetical protein
VTLKKCTVTQLDDTFWRVDWEGAATVDKDARRITHSSPRIAEHHDGEWFFCGYWSKSLADALFAWLADAAQSEAA